MSPLYFAVCCLVAASVLGDPIALHKRAWRPYHVEPIAGARGVACARVWHTGAFRRLQQAPLSLGGGAPLAVGARRSLGAGGMPLSGGTSSGSYYINGSMRGGQPVVGIADTGSGDFAVASNLCSNCGNASAIYDPAGAARVRCAGNADCLCTSYGQCFYDTYYADASGYSVRAPARVYVCVYLTHCTCFCVFVYVNVCVCFVRTCLRARLRHCGEGWLSMCAVKECVI